MPRPIDIFEPLPDFEAKREGRRGRPLEMPGDLEPELPPFTDDQAYAAKRLAKGATLQQIADEMNVSRSKVKEIKASLRDLNDQKQGLTPRKLLKMSGKKEQADAEMRSKPIVSNKIA